MSLVRPKNSIERSDWVLRKQILAMSLPSLFDATCVAEMAVKYQTEQRVYAVFVYEFQDGAGEGNRTLVLSLGSSCSTIELHPQCARAMPRQARVIAWLSGIATR